MKCSVMEAAISSKTCPSVTAGSSATAPLSSVLVSVGFQGSPKTAVDVFPASGRDGLALSGERLPGTGEYGGDGLIRMGRGKATAKLTGSHRTSADGFAVRMKRTEAGDTLPPFPAAKWQPQKSRRSTV